MASRPATAFLFEDQGGGTSQSNMSREEAADAQAKLHPQPFEAYRNADSARQSPGDKALEEDVPQRAVTKRISVEENGPQHSNSIEPEPTKKAAEPGNSSQVIKVGHLHCTALVDVFRLEGFASNSARQYSIQIWPKRSCKKPEVVRLYIKSNVGTEIMAAEVLGDQGLALRSLLREADEESVEYVVHIAERPKSKQDVQLEDASLGN